MADEFSGLKIVHLLTTVHHGGAERVVLELARRQRRLGADVMVLCLQQLGELLPAFEAAGIPVTLIDRTGRLGALRMAWRVAGRLKKLDRAVVHTHNSAPQIAAGLGERMRHWRRPGTVLVHTEHGRLPDARSRLLRVRRWTIAEFDRVFAVSADAREQLLQHGIRGLNGVDVILNGVDLARFVPRTESEWNGTHIVHVGRLDRIKGQDILLAAMPHVRNAVPAVRLTIVGDGPTRSALAAQARQLGVDSIVEFAGATDDVRPWLQAADLFVLPSRSEGISLALLEAMACGIPVVATDVGGNHEVIRSNTVGALVAAEQPEQLAAAMVKLLLAPDARRAMGAAGRIEVESRFDSQQTAHAYASHYQRARNASDGASARSAA